MSQAQYTRQSMSQGTDIQDGTKTGLFLEVRNHSFFWPTLYLYYYYCLWIRNIMSQDFKNYSSSIILE